MRLLHSIKHLIIGTALAALLPLALPAPALAAEGDVTQMLINKSNPLAADYVPDDLVYLSNYISAGSGVRMTEEAALALQRLVADARQAGVTGIYGASGYRSYSLQTTLSNNKEAAYRSQGYASAEAAALAATVVAPPGMSEHQSGMAIDITTAENGHSMTESFAGTRAGQWLAANCWKYGFILRYPADKTAITGYVYEPWHFRYVGQPHAEYMAKSGLTLEEYYAKLQNEGVLLCTTYNNKSYNVYYSDYDISPTLPGTVAGVSQARPAGGGYLITMQSNAETLHDLFGHWSEAEVRELARRGVIAGYPDNTFRPENNIDRAELITLIARMYQLLFPEGTLPTAAPDGGEADGARDNGADADETDGAYTVGRDPLAPQGTAATEAGGSAMAGPFADVDAGAYYYESLMLTWRAGLLAESMRMEQDGMLYFDAHRAVLRREVAESLAPLFSAMEEAEPSGIVFSDLAGESDTVRQAVQLLADYGVTQGDDFGRFLPNSYIKRAEISAMLIRIIHYYEAMDAPAPEEDADD